MRTAATILILISCEGNAQTQELKSREHGLEVMLTHVPKEEIIEEMRFEHGCDDTIDVIRFDHVGPNLYPLIISSKLPVPTDSVGILSFKLAKDTLSNFLEMIDNVTPKMSRKLDGVLVRVTYRYEGRLEQYYVTNLSITTEFLKMIEMKLINNKDPVALKKFYEFVAPMRLQTMVKGIRTWKY